MSYSNWVKLQLHVRSCMCESAE